MGHDKPLTLLGANRNAEWLQQHVFVMAPLSERER